MQDLSVLADFNHGRLCLYDEDIGLTINVTSSLVMKALDFPQKGWGF
jgi:hypothetical protein